MAFARERAGEKERVSERVSESERARARARASASERERAREIAREREMRPPPDHLGSYRGTSLIRKLPHLGPYMIPMARLYGGPRGFYERGTPVGP